MMTFQCSGESLSLVESKRRRGFTVYF